MNHPRMNHPRRNHPRMLVLSLSLLAVWLAAPTPASAAALTGTLTGPEGEPIVDSHGRRSYVTTAGNGPSVGKYLLLSYLPPEYANVGTKLAVVYMEEQYPVTVAVAGSTPLFDPKDERMKC